MMDFLFVNRQELTALMELPLMQRVAYLMGIRPYMDRHTCIVGIKRKISYQSLREALYVAPIAGVKTGSPSHQQMKRVVKSLERAGLVTIQSTATNLILKCVLAEVDRSVQNKAGMRPTPKDDTIQEGYTHLKSSSCKDLHKQADIMQMVQADPPHNSEDNYVFLSKKFENFWETYPQPYNKSHAWSEFKKLNLDDALFAKLLTALHAQIDHHQKQQSLGLWVPNWRYPANWLTQRGWEDEINTNKLQEKQHAPNKTRTSKQSVDFFWESCKNGADYIPEDDITPDSKNIIKFSEHRKAQEAY